jgi:hypothetical protein
MEGGEAQTSFSGQWLAMTLCVHNMCMIRPKNTKIVPQLLSIHYESCYGRSKSIGRSLDMELCELPNSGSSNKILLAQTWLSSYGSPFSVTKSDTSWFYAIQYAIKLDMGSRNQRWAQLHNYCLESHGNKSKLPTLPCTDYGSMRYLSYSQGGDAGITTGYMSPPAMHCLAILKCLWSVAINDICVKPT